MTRGSVEYRRGGGFPPRCAPPGAWGPKMRHLVLYKLAGFCHTDKVPLRPKTRGAMPSTFFQKTRILKKNLHGNAKFGPFLTQKRTFSHILCTSFARGVRPLFSGFGPPPKFVSRHGPARCDTDFCVAHVNVTDVPTIFL